MIELDKIFIKDAVAFVAARNKILVLAKRLKFDPISAIRIATMTSELTRRMFKTGQGSHIMVGLDRREGALGLTLLFSGGKGHG